MRLSGGMSAHPVAHPLGTEATMSSASKRLDSNGNPTNRHEPPRRLGCSGKAPSVALENRDPLIESRFESRIGIDVENLQIETQFDLKPVQRFFHVAAKVAPLTGIQGKTWRPARATFHSAP